MSFPRALMLPLVWLGLLSIGTVVLGAPAATRKPERKPPAQQPRTWTDATGKFKVRATLVEVDDDKVRLKKADGQVVTIPLEKLSEADQQWLEKQAAAPAEKTPQPASDWPGFRGASRDGKSPDKGLLKEWPAGGPPLLWKVDKIGKGYSSAAVAGGTVYVTGKSGDTLHLYAFGLDGKPKWEVEHGPEWKGSYPESRSTPTIDGDRLYLLSGAGLLVCYDTRRGDRKWQRDAKEFGGRPGEWGYAESVLIYQNLAVFKPGGQNCIVALDKANGKDVWASRGFAAGPEYSSCLAFTHENQPMIVTGTREGIVCVGAKNGGMLWANKFAAGNTANCPTPAYSDGYVFWANGYGKGGICIKLGSGGKATEAWTTRDMECHHGGFIIDDGHIYGNNGGAWACLELKSGEKKWQEHAVGKGSLCWADGMLYLFGEDGGKAALATCSPEGMKVTGNVKVDGDGPSWAHPVVIGGRLYLRYDTNLYCFDVKSH